MIDYELTIKRFFDAVKAYFTQCLNTARDLNTVDAVDKNLRVIRVLTYNPARYVTETARIMHGLGLEPHGFTDRRQYIAFTSVLAAIESYYTKSPSAEIASARLLAALKDWHYAVETSPFKSITYAFKNPAMFAAHINQYQK